MEMVVAVASLTILWIGISAGLLVLLLAVFFAARGRTRTQYALAHGLLDPGRAVGLILEAEERRAVSAPALEFKPKRRVILHKFQNLKPLSRILWVDDHPETNADEIAAFRLAGCTVVAVRTNATALNILSDNGFDVVISDIVRDEPFGPSGLQLFQQMYKRRSITKLPPMIFYDDADFEEIGRAIDQVGVYTVRAVSETKDETIEPFLSIDQLKDPYIVPATNSPAMLVDLVQRALNSGHDGRTDRVPPWYEGEGLV